MVAKLDMPTDCSLSILDSVIDERSKYPPLKDFYDDIRPHLGNQFRLYLSMRGNPEFIKPFELQRVTKNPKERKQTLINLYSPKEHQLPYKILKHMRKEHGLLCCPSCGEEGAPGTLDHYLPKDVFPEFAVCLANLTPMCNRCQEVKSTKYLTDSNRKAYIHPYFDKIDESYFHVEIRPPFNSPTFEIKIVRGEIGVVKLLIRHVIGVGFQERLKSFCRSKHIHLLKLMTKRRKRSNPPEVEDLIEMYLEPELEKSINSWPAIYYKSVLATPELLKHLDNGQLPQNLG